jgi:predicted DNA-binding transcriptional regulator AlpA
MERMVDADPVGETEIAERLGRPRQTVSTWRQRNTGFPEPRWTVGGRPAWDWSDIEAWARETGRLE